MPTDPLSSSPASFPDTGAKTGPAAAEGPEISVIIPHLNQPDFLRACLQSLADQTALPAGPVPVFEIIVVDNGSASLPDAVCADFPGTRLLSEPEPGPGPARNRGVAAAKGALLAFIDSDCLADPGWLARISAHFTAHPNDHILGGDVYIARDQDQLPTLIEAYESIYAYRMKEYIAKQGFTGTGNLAVRKEAMDEVGPFGGLAIAEDRDWGQRAGRAGFATRFVDGMIVYHPARRNFAELQMKWDRHVAHDCVRMRESRFWRLRWFGRMLLVLASPVGELPRILTSRRVAGPRARMLAFVGVLRIRLYRAWRMAALFFGADPEKISSGWNRA